MQRRAVAGVVAVVTASVAACSGAPARIGQSPASTPAIPPTRVTQDSSASTLVPPGFGTLKQEDVAIVLQSNNVRVTAIPLDEAIIRVIAPDSYRSLRATLENKRQQIAQLASMRGIRDPRVWYVTFTGLAPDARFIPTDITVTSGGRDYRPFDIIALTNGFGEQRLQPNSVQRGLLLFDEALDVSQPIVVATGAERNSDWETTLRRIDAERASIRARAGGRP
jgi:hypothetical protein